MQDWIGLLWTKKLKEVVAHLYNDYESTGLVCSIHMPADLQLIFEFTNADDSIAVSTVILSYRF
jgi:hypothetical protein